MVTDYQTKQRHRNMIVGLFVIIAMVAFFFFLWRFRDLPLIVNKMRSYQIVAYFPEVPGVQKDTPVEYCGRQIGRVVYVGGPDRRGLGGPHQVKVTMAIRNEYIDIPADSEFYVMRKGLGSSFVKIIQPDVIDPDTAEFIKPGIEIQNGKMGMDNAFFPPEFQDKLDELVVSITSLTEDADQVIGDLENRENIKEALRNVERATAKASETLESFTLFSKKGQEKVEVLSGQAETALKSVQGFADAGTQQVDMLADRLGAVTEQMESVLSEIRLISQKINEGDGTAGKLVNDGRLYENLLESSQELEMALEQIKEWSAEAKEKGIRINL